MKKRQKISLTDVQLLDSRDVAKLLRVSVETVNKWRQHTRGPRYYVMENRAIRYRLEDVLDWQRQSLVAVDPLRL